jgi:hypothetical protein
VDLLPEVGLPEQDLAGLLEQDLVDRLLQAGLLEPDLAVLLEVDLAVRVQVRAGLEAPVAEAVDPPRTQSSILRTARFPTPRRLERNPTI